MNQENDDSEAIRGERLRFLLNSSPSVAGTETEVELKSYLKSLRANRRALLASWMESADYTLDKPPTDFLAAVTSIQNRTRGHFGELLGRGSIGQGGRYLTKAGALRQRHHGTEFSTFSA